MLVSINGTALCNGTLAGGVAIGNARLSVDRIFDIVIPLDEESPVPFDRAVRRFTFTFTVQRVHADISAAESFILNLDDSIPSSGTVTISGGSSATIPNGVLLNHQSSQLGAMTTTTYTISGGAIT